VWSWRIRIRSLILHLLDKNPFPVQFFFHRVKCCNLSFNILYVVCSIDRNMLNCRHCSWHGSTHQQFGEFPVDYHREIVNFNAYRMDLCTLPIVKPVWMSMMAMLAWVNFSTNWQHSLISRDVSGIAVASYSLVNLNLYAITVYTLEEHCSMILGIVGEFPMDFHREIVNFNAYCLDLNHISHYI
jgi:hypothetical protein